MPLLFLKVHKIVWQKDAVPPFVPTGDIPADCLGDLRTQENELSVWHIEDDKSNLNRVLTALAACCEFVSNFDCLLFDHAVVTRLGLKMNQADGETPDNVANQSWHRDLVELSGKRMLDFAIEIFHGGETQRFPKKQVLELLKAAIAANEIDQSRLGQRVLREISNSAPEPGSP